MAMLKKFSMEEVSDTPIVVQKSVAFSKKTPPFRGDMVYNYIKVIF
ncbi:hypothetical protein [Streptococcus dysgalactiae]|nr:hypothetical protein [Streptococcus dysgalactiae]EFY01904.1 hypothetical protein SDD27957_01060 [Streptococcus dysgalactiae subsp. dysgalactiae ATCC 27957]MCB2846430.1 hypothetical protein [Streptococcus dysgalactiae subsp. dysgalactiae]MEE3742116.1 hypothetical protein [Streptococcus dysgalactiae]VDZ39497.1 Uncharacterised protein [Streptococcus dysgalactiae subsp. dysgalactiae]